MSLITAKRVHSINRTGATENQVGVALGAMTGK